MVLGFRIERLKPSGYLREIFDGIGEATFPEVVIMASGLNVECLKPIAHLREVAGSTGEAGLLEVVVLDLRRPC